MTECGSIDTSDGIRIYDSHKKEVVMWSREELCQDASALGAAVEAVILTTRCEVDVLKKLISGQFKP